MAKEVLPFHTREEYDDKRLELLAERASREESPLTDEEQYELLVQETLEACSRLSKLYASTGKWNPDHSARMKQAIKQLLLVCKGIYHPDQVAPVKVKHVVRGTDNDKNIG